MDLRQHDAKAHSVGEQAFHFNGTALYSGEGQVRYEQANGDTFIYANTSTAGGPEVVIKLDGLHDLVASDSIL